MMYGRARPKAVQTSVWSKANARRRGVTENGRVLVCEGPEGRGRGDFLEPGAERKRK